MKFRWLLRNFIIWISGDYFGISLYEFPMIISEFHYMNFRWIFRTFITLFAATIDVTNALNGNSACTIISWHQYLQVEGTNRKNRVIISCSWLFLVKTIQHFFLVRVLLYYTYIALQFIKSLKGGKNELNNLLLK